MRLVKGFHAQECSLNDALLLVRHGADVLTLAHGLNQPLTEKTKPDIRILATQIIRHCGKIGVNGIRILYSNRLRAIQTATILAEELFAAEIATQMCETEKLREVYQGEFTIVNHLDGEEYKPLMDAWRAWQCELDACELLYRFGDPSIGLDGIPKYPELVGWFKEFGEHQKEFSLRLYLMIKEIFEYPADGNLCMVVGHQATCSRIQRIISAVSTLTSANDFAPGELVRFLEKKGSRESIDHASGIIIRRPDRGLMLQALEKEIRYLRFL